MDSSFSTFSSNSVRQNLAERANRLIEKYELPVPRSWSAGSINYHFWAAVFNHIFGIKCDTLIRQHSERIEMIKASLNMLQIMIDQNLEHIQAQRLLIFDTVTIQNLLEVIELWEQSAVLNETENTLNEVSSNSTNLINNDNRSISTFNLNVPLDHNNTKSQELADKLDKSLKNQILAMEIEKKVKLYLGDVSVQQSNKNDSRMRASRHSIVRTRSIQPSATFDFSLNRTSKRNNVLSSDLQRLFPEIADDMLLKIQEQEKSLLIGQRNIRVWEEHLASKRVNRTLNEAITHQRQRLKLLEKEVEEEDSMSRAKKLRAEKIAIQSKQRAERAQKATLQKEIDQFFQQSTAAYRNARSHLERILVAEFKKVNANQRQQINEIRKYLQNHYETETDKLRTLLDNFDSMLY